jgi:hypothetical protein
VSEETRGKPVVAAAGEVGAAIKRTVLGSVLAGALCLYLGFQWDVGLIFQWALWVTGGAFLVVAAVASTGNRVGALLGAIVEALFALLLAAIAVNVLLAMRATGQFDWAAPILLVIVVFGISAARHNWSLFARSAAPRPPGAE